jgi:hypothetical protein
LITVALETAVLAVGLSRRHPLRHRLFAGVWLTACTYPIVWLILPLLFEERWAYLAVTEAFAPAAECLLFWLAFVKGREPDPRSTARDLAVVIVANLVSFGFGECLTSLGLWE